MKKILSRSEVVSCLSLEHGYWELVALSEAIYDEQASELIVKLTSELRPIPPQVRQPCPDLDWLPPDVTQREAVPLEDAFPLAKDIFRSWVKCLQKQATHFHQSAPEVETLAVHH